MPLSVNCILALFANLPLAEAEGFTPASESPSFPEATPAAVACPVGPTMAKILAELSGLPAGEFEGGEMMIDENEQTGTVHIVVEPRKDAPGEERHGPLAFEIRLEARVVG